MAKKKRLSAVEKQQAVFETLLESGKPMSAYEIHKATGLGTDSLHYHLRALVQSGILVPYDGGRYAIQKVYYDKLARKSLDVAMELIVTILATQTVWDFVDHGKQDEFSVVASNLEHYLRWLKKP